MKFLSLFSGIEAASTAWADLGWECVGFSEIEAFPCEVLAQRHPGVRNLGDVTKITEADILSLGHIDLVVFGSPCQDLSVAGKRKGLDGARSGLFFTALQIVEWAREWGDCRFALWENVPGAFSSNAGRDFAAVVDALAGVADTPVPPKGWGTEGCAVGPQAMVEWATLDAQWFGVAQRRRRVFAIADFGDWQRRPPILLEPESMRGDTAPSRETGKSVAGSLSARTKGGGGLGTDFECGGGLVPERRPVLTQPVVGAMAAAGGTAKKHGHAWGQQDWENGYCVPAATRQVSHCLNAGGMGRIDYETETETLVLGFNSNAQPDEMRFDPHLSAPLTCSQNSAVGITIHGTDGTVNVASYSDVAQCLRARTPGSIDNSSTTVVMQEVTHSLRAEGFDASEDGTGRGTPLVPVVVGSLSCNTGPNGHDAGNFACNQAVDAGHVVPVAYAVSLRGRDGGGTAELGDEVGNCLRASGGGGDKAHVLAYSTKLHNTTNNQAGKIYEEYTTALDRSSPPPALLTPMAVRRLTPKECERLQGFPDTYTAVTVRGKPAADGPRYKALGNSMAVPVMRWIGQQIDFAVEFF